MPRLLRERIENLLRAVELQSGASDPAAVDVAVGEPAAPPVDERVVIRHIVDELQPFDVAGLLEDLSEEDKLTLVRLISPWLAAAALEHLDYRDQYRLLDHVGEDAARAVLEEMPVHHLSPLLDAIHPLQADVLRGMLSDTALTHLGGMETLPEDAAGRRISVRYFEVRAEWTVRQALAHFRKVGANVDVANYAYVVDKAGRLVGVASMRELLLNAEDTAVQDIMYTKVVTVEAASNQEDAARLLNQYDFVALPVVNEAGRLIGIISADDIMDVMEEEATEDIHLLGGSVPLEESYVKSTVVSLFRSRVGWLLILFVAESFTGTIMRHFEDVLEQVIALAFFIPLLIDTGGNTGSQASTVVTRALAIGEVDWKDFFHIVWREARVSLLLGGVMALAAFARAMMLGGPAILGLTVGITICLIVMVGTTVGAALPLIGKRLGLDPAVFSAPLITTVADGLGLLIYFRVAVWLMGLT